MQHLFLVYRCNTDIKEKVPWWAIFLREPEAGQDDAKLKPYTFLWQAGWLMGIDPLMLA